MEPAQEVEAESSNKDHGKLVQDNWEGNETNTVVESVPVPVGMAIKELDAVLVPTAVDDAKLIHVTELTCFEP